MSVKAEDNIMLESKKPLYDSKQHFWFWGEIPEGKDPLVGTGAHISDVSESDFNDPSSPNYHEGGNLLARANCIIVRDGLIELAYFGADGMRIGKEDARHAVIGDAEFSFADELGQTVGTIKRAEASKRPWFVQPLIYPPDGQYTSVLQYNGSALTYNNHIISGSIEGFMYTDSEIDIWVKIGDDEGTCTLVTGENSDSDSKSFTVGSHTLTASITTDPRDISVGIGSIDSTTIEQTTAVVSGYSNRIFKPSTTVSFGNDGNVDSSGNTFSFGYGSSARGVNRIAMGTGARAQSRNFYQGGIQIALGAYNAIPAGGDLLLVIGNGHANNDRSNAVELKDTGDMTIAGTLTQGSDIRLKEHISYLDEDAIKFIRSLKPAHYIKDEEHHVGFYAQDVQEADEWDCMTSEMNGYMTLGYTELIAPLVAYCQHLEDRIRKLEEDK